MTARTTARARRLGALLLGVAGIALLASTAPAAACTADAEERGGDTVDVRGDCPGSTNGGDGGDEEHTDVETTEPWSPADQAWEPTWDTHPETGEPCIRWIDHRERDSDIANSHRAADWEQRALAMMGDPRIADVDHRFCNQRGPQDPTLEATAFVRRIPIPAPTLAIAPGWALAGMPAYLEIDDQADFTVVEDDLAGFGRLRVELEPTSFEVRWHEDHVVLVDDGRTGAPWDGDPSQHIAHTYTHADGANVVTVIARWQATWRVGGFAGLVAGLAATEELPLEVQQRQAIRVAP